MNTNRVKELRLSLKLSQKELGERTNISQQMISKIENDDRNLTKDNLISLARFFRVSTDYLLGIGDIRCTQQQESERLSRYEQYDALIRICEDMGNKGNKVLLDIARVLAESSLN
jgi:transcriptional regulator with XRE-family HTH domain